MRNQPKCFYMSFVVHDAFSGLALPSFIALCLTSVIPDLMDSIDPHSLQLAGLLGLIYTIAEIVGPGHLLKADPPPRA
jgi:hypothetical protein